MPFNAGNKQAGDAEIPLSTFSGLVTEMNPSDLPEGPSPDCQDVVFVPGSVSSRPALQKVLVSALPGNPTISYGKSYVDPTGKVRNLYFDSLGVIWLEDPINAPGVVTKLLQSTPNCYAKSITAFGREYIAISDGLHGQEVPLQYDGTNLDRVTQDGPGGPPSVVNLALPALPMAVTSSPPPAVSISSISTTGLVVNPPQPPHFAGSSYYTTITVVLASMTTLTVGQAVQITGNSYAPFNTTVVISSIVSPTTFVAGFYSTLFHSGTGGSSNINPPGITLTRTSNTVTAQTTAPNQLQVGYQVQISGVPANQVGGTGWVAVINNEDAPGIATFTHTPEPHGLVPGAFVTITGIPGQIIGGGITLAVRRGTVVQIITAAPNNVTPGSIVTIEGVTDASLNGTFVVQNVNDPTFFTYIQNNPVDSAVSSGGNVVLEWPITGGPGANVYEVIAAPTPNSFQVQLAYSDGTWGGNFSVAFAWDGTFYVSAILSPTEFQYQQYGPDASTTAVGTVTPFGQVAPGKHQMQVLFLTRQDYITKPSPPVTFIANGGQYLSVTNIPIGPPNVVARILAFTGAAGAYFFYIPVPAQVNGQVVSTATQINDNTTTSAVLDFSDNTLYAALGISIPGNTLANEIVLDSALAFGYYGQRLITFGQRNRLLNLLNPGFDGGYFPVTPALPTGWSGTLNVGGALATGHFGQGWQITLPGSAGNYGQISQSFYEDAYGAPIGTPNTPYNIRFWGQAVSGSGYTLTFAVTSVSASYSSTATFTSLPAAGGWVEGVFSLPMPPAIPSDMILSIYATGGSAAVLLIDEVSIIYAQTPYLEGILYGSYTNNPEAFDGVTGKFGPVEDTHKVMALGIIRSNLYLLTQDPSGRLHQTSNSSSTEPAGWIVDEVGSNCGALSAFCVTQSQADDSSASGGEEWFAWASESGARIFGGSDPWKISQEIQPDWSNINSAANATIWSLNDPVARVIYFGLPIGSASTPSLIYPMNYRELDGAYQIAMSPPVHTSFSGKLIATDNTRKWTRWNLAIKGTARMYHGTANALSATLFCGANFGNVYTLNSSLFTDDDYGQIFPYYTTFAFINHDLEIALGVGAHRKTLIYFATQVVGIGNITITALINNLTNPWPLNVVRPMSTNPAFDMEWTGGNAVGPRMFFNFASSPIMGTDNFFQLQKVLGYFRETKRLPVRGAAQ